MGKIRVNTIGDENLEQKQKKQAEKRRESKKTTKMEGMEGSEEQKVPKEPEGEIIRENQLSINENQKEQKKKTPSFTKVSAGKQKKAKAKKIRSSRYITSKKIVDRNKLYQVAEALEVLSRMQKAQFDETVELHINTLEKGVSGNVTLPHGTGKQTKVAIIAPAKDPKAADELLKQIEAGKIDFDVLLATPDAMPKLAKVAKILGPRGLMPNPKNGTISPNPEALAKKYEGGQMNYKTEAKSPIIHVSVGKMSFGKEKLSENISILFNSIEKEKMRNAYIKSTMSPSLKLVI